MNGTKSSRAAVDTDKGLAENGTLRAAISKLIAAPGENETAQTLAGAVFSRQVAAAYLAMTQAPLGKYCSVQVI